MSLPTPDIIMATPLNLNAPGTVTNETEESNRFLGQINY